MTLTYELIMTIKISCISPSYEPTWSEMFDASPLTNPYSKQTRRISPCNVANLGPFMADMTAGDPRDDISNRHHIHVLYTARTCIQWSRDSLFYDDVAYEYC